MKSNHNLTTALYTRLSQEDLLQGESNSIRNQNMICQGVFLRKVPKIKKTHKTTVIIQAIVLCVNFSIYGIKKHSLYTGLDYPDVQRHLPVR